MSEHGAAGPSAGARIVDRGYQHYTGARLGPRHALWVMTGATVRRALGIRMSVRAKILPWLLILAAFVPAVILLAIRIILHGVAPLPGYDALYNQTSILFVLFAATIAPDLLCPDHRQRVLSLYFAAPITRLHYVGARIIGMILVLLLLTLVPMLLLFSASALLADSAAGYVQSHAGDLWRLVASGGLLALYYGAVALAVSAFTDRHAYATGAYLGLLLVSAAAVGVLLRTLGYKGHEWIELLGLAALPVRAVDLLFAGGGGGGGINNDPINVWGYLGASLAVIVVSLGLLVWRYVRLRD